MPDDSKVCTKCERDLPFTSYGRNRAANDGFSHRCKQCCADHLREWRRKNPDKTREQRKRQYEANADRMREKSREKAQAAAARDPEGARQRRKDSYTRHRDKILAKSKAYREANAAKIKADAKKWREQNAAKHAAAGLAWRKQNPERVAEYNRRTRARRSGVEHTPYTRREIYDRDGGRCRICNTDLPFAPNGFHLDHIVPISLGGPDIPANVQLACAPCNQRKHAKLEGQIALPV